MTMNELERKIYEAVTETTREYAWSQGISDGFLLAMPQRQVTSCPAAIASAWHEHGQAAEELLEDSLESIDGEEDTLPEAPLRDILSRVVASSIDVAELERNDSKFSRLISVSREFLNARQRKRSSSSPPLPGYRRVLEAQAGRKGCLR
ncbi:MAG: hypothetical protein IPJ28_13770 [Betaproteobacteria bacterium]|nr:hypothetical protein [Betaproteobacteria bacterium]